MYKEGDALLTSQLQESARHLTAAVSLSGAATGLGDQLAAVTDELCWEVGLIDVDDSPGAATDPLGWPRLDHVGIMVRDLGATTRFYVERLGAVLVAGGDAPHESMRTTHLRFAGGGKLEIMTPLGPGQAADYLDRRGEGVHHLTFAGFDVAAAATGLADAGIRVADTMTDSSWMNQLMVGPRSGAAVAVQVIDRSDHYGSSIEGITLDDVLAGRWTWVDGVPVTEASPG